MGNWWSQKDRALWDNHGEAVADAQRRADETGQRQSVRRDGPRLWSVNRTNLHKGEKNSTGEYRGK